ncbi:MAG: hypothetical protein ACTSXL_02605 [Alphaproteobacteria bacterium]
MKKILFIGVLMLATTSFAKTSAFCAQQFSFISQNYGVAVSQGGSDADLLKASKKPGSKRFICKCKKFHAKYMANVIDNKQRAFMTGKLFVGNSPKTIKQLICK